MPKRHALLHRLLKSMDKDEPAFIETPFTVDYVRIPCSAAHLANITWVCCICNRGPMPQCFSCLVSFCRHLIAHWLLTQYYCMAYLAVTGALFLKRKAI